MGWTPGQEDFAELTREIKGADLTGVGPFYVWRERYKSEAPFGNVDQAIPVLSGIPMTFTLSSTLLTRGTTFKGQFTLASQVAFAKANVTGAIHGQSTDQSVWGFVDV